MNVLLEHVEYAKIVRPRPGDMIVFKYPKRMKDGDYTDSYNRLKIFMKENYPHVKFVTSREIEDVYIVKAGDL